MLTRCFMRPQSGARRVGWLERIGLALQGEVGSPFRVTTRAAGASTLCAMNITRTVSIATAAAALAVAAPAGATSHKTLRFYSKQSSERIIHQDGSPVTGEPAVGDIF